MISFADDIRTRTIPTGCFGLFFAGQAGYILKGPDNSLTAVDLYLSDCCARLVNLKRLAPYLLDASDLYFNTIICTHEHPDHLDIDVLPQMAMLGNPVLYMNRESIDIMKIYGNFKNIKLLEAGNNYYEGSLKIEAVPCDHGQSAPNAVGLLLTLGSKTMYIAGDTSFRPDIASSVAKYHIDVMAAPINGAFGNLNEEEAVRMCEIVKPSLMIPYHFWNFAEHGGNPHLFMKKMAEILPDQKYLIMRPGEGVII